LGLPAAAVLLVNNYRDLEDDLRSGRQTFVALLGRPAAKTAYAVMMLLPFALVLLLAWHGRFGALLACLVLPHSLRLTRQLSLHADGKALNALLASTARTSLFLGLLMSFGVIL
jgi:1,4-dihydroxy-2-naphthoate octaprenyltransferase